MKNFFNLLFLSVLLSIFLISQTSCHSSLEPELANANSELRGEWKVTSFLLNEEEQLGHSMHDFMMEFAPEEASSGVSRWLWTNGQGESTSEENFYTLSADGRTILLSGETYQLDMDTNSFEMSCDQTVGRCIIIAELR